MATLLNDREAYSSTLTFTLQITPVHSQAIPAGLAQPHHWPSSCLSVPTMNTGQVIANKAPIT